MLLLRSCVKQEMGRQRGQRRSPEVHGAMHLLCSEKDCSLLRRVQAASRGVEARKGTHKVGLQEDLPPGYRVKMEEEQITQENGKEASESPAESGACSLVVRAPT